MEIEQRAEILDDVVASFFGDVSAADISFEAACDNFLAKKDGKVEKGAYTKAADKKRLLLFQMVEQQLGETGKFKFPVLEIENPCPDCRGMGSMFVMLRNEEEIPCSCGGTGKALRRCQNCNGTKRIQRGGVIFRCTSCNEQGQEEVQCRCKGTGKVLWKVMRHIKVAHPCRSCAGTGRKLEEGELNFLLEEMRLLPQQHAKSQLQEELEKVVKKGRKK